MIPGLPNASSASISSFPNVLRSSTNVAAGRSDGSGFATSMTHVVAPLVFMSCHLLYICCTVHVFGPTVIVPFAPLQMSPFSVSNGVTRSTHPVNGCGSENISESSCDATCVCRCSCVCAVCSEHVESSEQV